MRSARGWRFFKFGFNFKLFCHSETPFFVQVSLLVFRFLLCLLPWFFFRFLHSLPFFTMFFRCHVRPTTGTSFFKLFQWLSMVVKQNNHSSWFCLIEWSFHNFTTRILGCDTRLCKHDKMRIAWLFMDLYSHMVLICWSVSIARPRKRSVTVFQLFVKIYHNPIHCQSANISRLSI